MQKKRNTSSASEINMIESKLAGIGMKRYGILMVLFLTTACVLSGCSASGEEDGEWEKVEFTVVDPHGLPEELLDVIEENKDREIRMAYEDGEDLYLVRGYGKQNSGGFSIAGKECVEKEEVIRLETQLIGPESPEGLPKDPSCPYLVIKMEMSDKQVEIE